jgi:hypothetical protein
MALRVSAARRGDRRRASDVSSLDHVLVDSDFATLDFSSRKLAENLYGFRDRICAFPKEFDGKGRNGARFFENRMFACILRADATPPPHRGV